MYVSSPQAPKVAQIAFGLGDNMGYWSMGSLQKRMGNWHEESITADKVGQMSTLTAKKLYEILTISDYSKD